MAGVVVVMCGGVVGLLRNGMAWEWEPWNGRKWTGERAGPVNEEGDHGGIGEGDRRADDEDVDPRRGGRGNCAGEIVVVDGGSTNLALRMTIIFSKFRCTCRGRIVGFGVRIIVAVMMFT